MLRTVQFYNQSGFVTIKIYNIITNHILPAEAERIPAQKLIPQMRFLFGHVPSQNLCTSG